MPKLHDLAGKGIRLQGRVKFFSEETGWGFITLEGSPKDVYLHISKVLPAADNIVYQPICGCVVEFEIQISKRTNKPAATKVRILKYPEPTFEEQFAAAEELPLT